MTDRMWGRDRGRTRIKLCEFESLDPAYEASRLDIDALGFHIFKTQEADVKLRAFVEIFKYLPKTISKTLLTDLELEDLAAALAVLPVDAIQLYPDWDAEKIGALKRRIAPGIRILKVMSARPHENAIRDSREFVGYYGAHVDAFLLDSFRIGGTGEVADWDHCAEIVRHSALPVILAGGLTAENVGEAIRRTRPFGVDVENGVSDRIPDGPLVKNMAKCARFVEAVRKADAEHRGASGG